MKNPGEATWPKRAPERAWTEHAPREKSPLANKILQDKA